MVCHDENLQKNIEILNQYNFEPYLELYDDLDELMYNFEYECDISILPSEYGNCVFNWISTSEFAEYLCNRYPDYYIEEISRYRIWR